MISYNQERNLGTIFFFFLMLNTQWSGRPIGKIGEDVENEIFNMFKQKKVHFCIRKCSYYAHILSAPTSSLFFLPQSREAFFILLLQET